MGYALRHGTDKACAASTHILTDSPYPETH